MAFFVAAIEFKNRWHTKDSAKINGREIGPGTVIISTKSEMNKKRKNIERDTGIRWNLVRILLADFLDLQPNLKDIKRPGKTFMNSRAALF